MRVCVGVAGSRPHPDSVRPLVLAPRLEGAPSEARARNADSSLPELGFGMAQV